MIPDLKLASKIVVKVGREIKGATLKHPTNATLAKGKNRKIRRRKRGRAQNVSCINPLPIQQTFSKISNQILKRELKKDQLRLP